MTHWLECKVFSRCWGLVLYLKEEAALPECWLVRGPLVGSGCCCSWMQGGPLDLIPDPVQSRYLELDLDPDSGFVREDLP